MIRVVDTGFVEKIVQENAILRAQVAQLEEAIEWALERMDGADEWNYWGKIASELRRRVGRE